MSETLHVELPESLRRFAEERVRKGEYSTVDDYLGSLIERDRASAAAAQQLRALIQQGIDSGTARRLTESDWVDLRRRAIHSGA